MDDTFSDISQVMSRAYSEITHKSDFDKFYSRWEGIINSGKCIEDPGPLHFFDEHAWVKLPKDDENLKVLANL